MNISKIISGIALIGVMGLGAGVIGAQDNMPPGVSAVRALVQIVSEETGLTPQEIVAQVQDGATLADVITGAGGDVYAVIAEAVAAATERVNEAVANGTITQERADQILANLEDVITRAVNGELAQPGRGLAARLRGAHILIQAAADETGLTAREILQQVRDGLTLAEVITANSGNVETVVASAVAEATEQINTAVENGNLTQAQADELIASLETVFTDAVNGELPGRPVQRAVARGIVRQVSQATGLEVSEVVDRLRDGATIADILTANSVDVDTFIGDVIARAEGWLDQAVANGRITQERADEMLARLTERLTELVNETYPVEDSV